MWFLCLNRNEPNDVGAVEVWEIDDEQADQVRALFGQSMGSVLVPTSVAADALKDAVIVGGP